MHRLKNSHGGFLLFALALLFCNAGHARILDLNTNGMSDVWEQLFGAVGLDPNGDADGDGVSNLKESIAGTNPFNPNSVPKISSMTKVGNNFTVTMSSALGKQYQLQSVQPDVSGWTNWTVEATLPARTGTVVTLTAPTGISAKFFRVAISDIDSDGDGLSDWEEYQLGLDPFNAFSNNQLDAFGQPMNDYQYAASRIVSQNVVSITASDPTCVQPDPGALAQDLGQFTITRGGFPLNLITVGLGLGGSGSGFAVSGLDFASLPPFVSLPPGVGSTTVSVRPLANTNLLTPVVLQLNVQPGSGYTVGSSSNASVIVYPSQTPNGTGLTGFYFTNSSPTYANSANFNSANLKLTRLDPGINFNWGSTNYLPITNGGYYSIRWLGQVQPQYSETYFFNGYTDDGFRLWVNDQLIIDNWVAHSASNSIGSISLQAGVRYNIKMEYFNGGGNGVAQLSWWSASQASNAIPAARLYPTNSAPAPAVVTSPLVAYGYVGVPFSFTNTADNTPTGFGATPMPPGLGYTNNGAYGVLAGTPSLAGTYQLMVTATNAVGASASVLTVTIFDTSAANVVREVWTNAPGVRIADIPLATPPSSVTPLTTLEGITDFGDNYGERIRGFITVPVTGNYYFWIAGSDSAELWVSNNQEPVNKVRRAYVSPTANPTPPPANGTASRQWNLQANQQSSWLAMQAGQKYYIEILHKADAGAGDNWSVGWLQDPLGTGTTPTGIVPTYVLSPYYQPPPSVAQGTLYVADMVAGPGVTNMPYGSATLRLSADNSRAVLNFSFSDISSTVISEHIDNDPYLVSPSGIMFDISDTAPQPDGSYLWSIGPVGTLSASDVLNVLNQGKAYITILTLGYPNGELIGHFAPVDGSPSFTPPAAPPAWTDDHTSTNAVSRFLTQATFGPSPSDIASVISIGYTNWLSNQFSTPASHFLPLVLAEPNPDPTVPYPENTLFNIWWQQSTTAPDQLRQRVAFALSEIMVASSVGVLQDNGRALADYYDTLLDDAFVNFRQLLEDVSLTSAMGLYLNMQANDKGNIIMGTHANENYAREIMQLFSIGLNRLWPDGSLVLDSTGSLVPTYDQNVIMGVAADFTGWNYWQPLQGNGRLPASFSPSANYTNPMVLVPTHHDLNTKRLLDNVVLPAAQGAQADSTKTNFDNYCLQDLELALNNIFNNQNVGPFFCRELIQRLVTSQPSPGYLYRVVHVFNDNGSGVRGDMQAVLSAILLDYEARSPNSVTNVTFGKQREPVLRITAPARALPAPAPLAATYSQTSNTTITVTTSAGHRLNNSDIVQLNFTDTSGQPAPSSQGYSVTVTSPTTFTFGSPGITSATYTQTVAGIIFVTNSSHGLALSNSVYLSFTTGGAISGIYQVTGVTNANVFTVNATEAVARSGAGLVPKISGGGYTITQKTNILMSTTYPHGLQPGNTFYVNFTVAGSPADGLYTVLTVPDPLHFTFVVPTAPNNGTQNSMTFYPLVAPPVPRSGTAQLQWNTWIMGQTDTGSTYNLAQAPMHSPTVFNFFFPDFKFPGALAAAGLTTPEFQLTSDTSVALQMNFLEGGIMLGNNTNGITSFIGNGGAVNIDIGPWMTAGYTSTASSLSNLVDSLSAILCGGQVTPYTKGQIVNFALTQTGSTQARDRARTVVHMILNSPEYTIQK
jgi:hypothetical protein